MRVFIAGVMQGTRRGAAIVPQTYREEIAQILRRFIPGVEIWDPNQIHPDGVNYDRERAKRTLLEMAELAAAADCLVAYVPEASMGTAIEMWQAYRAGVPVYTISPLTENWVIFTLSTEIFPDIPSFAKFVASGGLAKRPG
ncbi:MAG TPA: hypothetical protein ENK08_10190 [Chloroflexi bacterium]|nr:hypothetical protein [Chloroflexota bacterium]